jgi:hypothetical protein
MAETDLHRRLASALHGYMRRAGVTVTHSVATLSLPDPVRIVRHEPDVLGYGGDCVCIGEAKRGPELFDRHTQEQLYDFSRRHVTGWGRSTFFLYVPRAYRERARAAIIAARRRHLEHAHHRPAGGPRDSWPPATCSPSR